MAARAVWLLLAVPAVPLLYQQLRSAGLNLGWKDIFLLGGRGLLFLAILTFIISMTAPWLTSRAPSKVCSTGIIKENCPDILQPEGEIDIERICHSPPERYPQVKPPGDTYSLIPAFQVKERALQAARKKQFKHPGATAKVPHLAERRCDPRTTGSRSSGTPTTPHPSVTEDENKRRQKRVREEQQETLSSKSSGYLENVLKPRQEMKLRKQEERFCRMTGESWRLLEGCKLGGPEEPGLAGEDGAPGDTPSRKASRRRKLPEPASRVSASPEQPRAKKVLALPEEPPETAAEVVAVALRCPDGRMFRRRFYKSCSAQVLLDWMMKVGYHSSIYTLSNSYPRRPLEVGEDQTLEDTGLTTDTVLNVEEKEPCPSP